MHNVESVCSWRRCYYGPRQGAYKRLVIFSKLPGARVCLHDHEQRSLIQQMKAESKVFSFYYCARGHGHAELKIFFENIDFPLFVPTTTPPIAKGHRSRNHGPASLPTIYLYRQLRGSTRPPGPTALSTHCTIHAFFLSIEGRSQHPAYGVTL